MFKIFSILGGPNCSFWDVESNEWSSEGCRLLDGESPEFSVCQCDHLTNFAVILDVNGNLEDKVGIY